MPHQLQYPGLSLCRRWQELQVPSLGPCSAGKGRQHTMCFTRSPCSLQEVRLAPCHLGPWLPRLPGRSCQTATDSALPQPARGHSSPSPFFATAITCLSFPWPLFNFLHTCTFLLHNIWRMNLDDNMPLFFSSSSLAYVTLLGKVLFFSYFEKCFSFRVSSYFSYLHTLKRCAFWNGSTFQMQIRIV